MTLDDIRRIESKVRERYSYAPDAAGVSGDTWRSRWAEVKAGKFWIGDCDDLTCTVLDALLESGCGLDQLYRLVVSTDNPKVPDHMVGCIWYLGECWIVGDTFGPCYPAEYCHHFPIIYQRMDELPMWRDGFPWT